MRHFIKYSLIVIVIAIIVILAIHFIKNDYKTYLAEEIETEMLQVRAKAKLEFAKYKLNNDNGLKGEKIENSEYGIEQEGNFFKWTKETLEEVELNQSKLKDGEYYIVNYDTEEVIYVTNSEKYKLSELEKEEASNNVNNIEENVEGEKQEDEREGDTKTE